MRRELSRRVKVFLAAAGVTAAALFAIAIAAQMWWQWMYPVAQFRYKLTVEVMTPDGLKSGSSVIEVRYSSSHPIPNPGRYYNDALVAGEAVYVDLGRGKNLFVLLGNYLSGRNAGGINGDHGERFTATPSERSAKNGVSATGALSLLELPKFVLDLKRWPGDENTLVPRLRLLVAASPITVQNVDNLPTLVTFADMADMDTAKIVQPTELEEAIGRGYRLHRAIMNITEEPPSETILAVLPWLKAFKQHHWPNRRKGPAIINSLEYRSFKQPG